MPVWLKLNLTKQEAAAYSNIGINRIEELLKQPNCNFVLYVGNKKLVKRKEFEQYISKSMLFRVEKGARLCYHNMRVSAFCFALKMAHNQIPKSQNPRKFKVF